MDKLALIISLVALAAGGYAFLGDGGASTDTATAAPSSELAALREEVQALREQIQTLTPGEVLSGRAAPAGTVADGPQLTGHAGATGEAPLHGRAEGAPTLASLQAEIASLRERVEAAPDAPMQRMVQRAVGNRFFNVEQAAAALELDEMQRRDMDQTVQDTREELQRLYAMENDEGLTYDEARKGRTMGSEDQGFRISMPDFHKMKAWRESRIPGSSETFAEAEQRIISQANDDIGRRLTPEQNEKWEKANRDHLYGSHGVPGGVTMVTTSFGGLAEDD